MPRPTPVRLAALMAALAATPAAAQPPAYSRWSGTTALTQPQGLSQGSPLTLTWGFMALGTPINDASNNGIATAVNAPNNLQTFLNTSYGSQATWQPLFTGVFNRWSQVSGLSYQFEANDDGAAVGGANGFPSGALNTRADIRIGGKFIDGESGANVLAYNYFPNVGEMVIDTANPNFFGNTTNNSIGLRNVVAHEHGHGIGMPHGISNNTNFLMEPSINTSFDGPQYHDILAAQHMYGDVREKTNGGLGNDTVARANPLGTITASTPASIGNSARTLTVAATATDFVSIDSSTDTDVYSFTVNEAGRMTATLEALGFTYNLTPQTSSTGPTDGSVPFNTRLRNDLRIELLAADGTTVLQTIDAGGLGANELLEFDLLAGGTYYLRVAGTNNGDAILLDTQFYGLTVQFVPVPEPAAALLVAAAGAWAARRRRAG